MIGVLGQYAFTPKLVGDLGFGYGTTFDAQMQGNEMDMTMANYNTTTLTWSYSYADTNFISDIKYLLNFSMIVYYYSLLMNVNFWRK